MTTRRCAPPMVGVSEVPVCGITRQSRSPGDQRSFKAALAASGMNEE